VDSTDHAWPYGGVRDLLRREWLTVVDANDDSMGNPYTVIVPLNALAARCRALAAEVTP
jgi:hypothetical protein